jgi:hypothetical protein
MVPSSEIPHLVNWEREDGRKPKLWDESILVKTVE